MKQQSETEIFAESAWKTNPLESMFNNAEVGDKLNIDHKLYQIVGKREGRVYLMPLDQPIISPDYFPEEY